MCHVADTDLFILCSNKNVRKNNVFVEDFIVIDLTK